jgi:hypothetical protein
VIQSNYIPWRGYFDFIRSVDLFVFHDDLQYTKQDWRNRNRLRVPAGTAWLTVPVKKSPADTSIDEIETCGSWRVEHEKQLKQHLGNAPHFAIAFALWRGSASRFLGEMNRSLITRICEYLGIRTPLLHSRELGLSGGKTERLVQLMQRVGGKTYVSGPAAKDYLEVQMMNDAGIAVEWKTYGPYKDYPQQYSGFEPAVSILDLIANVGYESRSYL